MKYFRKLALLLPVIVALAAAQAPAQTVARRAKPNIILIQADDLGYGDLGSYGQRMIKTPQLDRMAAEGTRFTQYYAGSTVCAPSRCALMTGLHMGHALIRGNDRVPLRDQDKTVAEVLRAAGYATGIFGKWGLGNEDTTGIPTRQGFDEWFGYLDQRHAHEYYPDFLWKNEQKVALSKEYSHDLFTRHALDFVGRHRGDPFFLYLAYTIPHANTGLGRQTGNGMQVPSDAPYSSEQWPQPQKNFAAMVTRMDDDIGKLFAHLKSLSLDENTVVFFTSDNGPHKEGGINPDFFDSNGPLRGIKRDLYEGGIRVPMIVRWPGRVRAGAVSLQVWAHWDFLPTAAELAGVRPPSGIDGLSMRPALLGRRQPNHEYLYWEFFEGGFKQALRLGRWKAVRRPGQSLELYDLASDPSEQRDEAFQNPSIVARATEWMSKARVDSEHWKVN